MAPVDLTNSPRLDQLLRAGNIYLSLSDAIALAIQNNLDVELQRYKLPTADTEVLRAKGGGLLRGLLLQPGRSAQSAWAARPVHW